MDRRTDFPSYHFIRKLGLGMYGVVYEVKSNNDDQIYALKRIELTPEEGFPTSAIREISILKELNDPCIVRLHRVIKTRTLLNMAFELCECDLTHAMKRNPLDPFTLKCYLYQLLRGMAFCHQKKILHRDLKPQNLLIGKDGQLKIADFGLSRGFSVPAKSYTSDVVTLWYRAPELLMGTQLYSSAIDIWSVGCIFAEMVKNRPLWPGSGEEDQLIRIFESLGPPNEQQWPELASLPKHKSTLNVTRSHKTLRHVLSVLDESAIDLLEQLLQINPNHRISASAALSHHYFFDLPQEFISKYPRWT